MASTSRERRPNPQRRIAVACFAVALVAGVGVALPWLTGMDMMSAGYAIATIAAVVCVTALISAALFFARARSLDRMLAGDRLLAHWTYDAEAWGRYVRDEHRANLAENRARFIVVAAFAIVIGVGFLFLAPDSGAGFFVFLTMLGLIAIIGLAAFLSTRLRGPHPGSRREAFISRDGVYIGGAFHLWGRGGAAAGASFERAVLIPGGHPRLEFEYSYPTRYGRDSTTVRVPVPPGLDEAARELVAQFSDAPPTPSRAQAR